jgi:hypothetical protein
MKYMVFSRCESEGDSNESWDGNWLLWRSAIEAQDAATAINLVARGNGGLDEKMRFIAAPFETAIHAWATPVRDIHVEKSALPVRT